MSKEAAERFVTAWDAREPEVAKAVPHTSFDLEALTSIAVSLGYEVEAAEIAEQLQLQREQALMQANASVVSVEELEQVVGGLCEDPCADTYDTYATC